MKNAFKFFGNFLTKIFKTELKSVAGRANLGGGLLLVVFGVIAFVSDWFNVAINALLSSFGKEQLPAMPGYYILAALAILALYFYFCVKVLLEAEG